MPDIALHRPNSIAAGVRILAADDGARCIAGGQTLVAMLNANLVEPTALVDLAGIAALLGIDVTPRGEMRIGAMVTHRDVAAEARLIHAHAVVREAAVQIAHPGIRNKGTIGGSVCHADPAADYPAALVAADARFEIAGVQGTRQAAATEFFKTYLTTDLAPGEMLIAVHLPPAPASSVGHYLKFARVDGDYATLSVAVCLDLQDGVCTDARVVLGASGPTPIFANDAHELLIGSRLDPDTIAKAAAILVDASDPPDDVRGSSDYRRKLIPRLVLRAIVVACAKGQRA